jgi:hypothetical protein
VEANTSKCRSDSYAYPSRSRSSSGWDPGTLYTQHTTVGILCWELLAAWDTLKEHARKTKPKQETRGPADDQETSLP